MGIIVFNPNKKEVDSEFEKIIENYSSKIDKLIVCVGGDGAILGAEDKYPGVPKLAIRASNVCYRCTIGDNLEEILEKIVTKTIKPRDFYKLEIEVGGKKLIALNEFSLKSENPGGAVRFKYAVNKKWSGEIIGDGIVVATVFGATGYFKSITGTIFHCGMGIGINNPTISCVNEVVCENDIISIEVTRGPGIVLADNNPATVKVLTGEKIVIKKTQDKALIY